MSDDDSDEDDLIVVIDHGSSTCKAGFAGDKTVSCRIPTAIGKHHSGVELPREGKLYIGDEVYEKQGILTLNYPVEKGVIQNFEDMEKIWDHIIYRELRIKQPFSVLLTEPPLNPKGNREKMAEIMFEKFDALRLNIALQHELALVASCRTSGVVIDSGEGSTDIVCIRNGQAIRDSIVQLELGGRDLSKYLSTRLMECGGESSDEWRDVAHIKHELCYISMDYEEERKAFSSNRKLYKSYKTSTGKLVEVGNECFQCPEILFEPSIINKTFGGVHHATYDSILKSPVDTQDELYTNIIYSGGNTMFRDIAERTKKEIELLAPPGANIKVIAPPERLKSVWLGGSIIGSVSAFQHEFVTREQYNEHGPSIF